MASRKSLHNAKPNYIYPTVISSSEDTNTDIEFDESDLYSLNESTVVIIRNINDRLIQSSAVDRSGENNRVGSGSSLPMNIPDWSKILMMKKDDQMIMSWSDDDDDDFGEENDVPELEIDGGDCEGRWVPPHEYLARRRGSGGAPFSALKGSEYLRRARNAIWKEVGFED